MGEVVLPRFSAPENYSRLAVVYSCGVVCVIQRLAVLVEHRLVTDGRTDGQTNTRRQLIPALASVVRVKLAHLETAKLLFGF